MTSTPLIYREEAATGTERGTLVLLHGLGGDIGQLSPLSRALGLPLRTIAAQAWRACNPRQYAASERTGFLWYFDHGPDRPEAATFGDALWAVEQFLTELANNPGARPIFLLGYGQGAVLAATLAGVLPDLLAGVALIGGYVPRVPGWSPPFRKMKGLPVLMINASDQPSPVRERVAWTVETLAGLGGDVRSCECATAGDNPMAAVGDMGAWFDDQLAVTNAT